MQHLLKINLLKSDAEKYRNSGSAMGGGLEELSPQIPLEWKLRQTPPLPSDFTELAPPLYRNLKQFLEIFSGENIPRKFQRTDEKKPARVNDG